MDEKNLSEVVQVDDAARKSSTVAKEAVVSSINNIDIGHLLTLLISVIVSICCVDCRS